MTEKEANTTTQKHSNRLRIFLISALLSFVIFQALKEPPYTNLENDQLQVMLQSDVPVYDIRRPEEWQQTGIIEGSQLLTYVDSDGLILEDFITRFTADVDKDDPVILICRTGNRTSSLAYYLVEELGYTNVYNVEDGISRWIREQRPIQSIIKPTTEIQDL